MDLIVSALPGKTIGTARFGDRNYRCALGRGAMRGDKREGDGATPVGRFALRRLFYRADRLQRPSTGLPVQALDVHDGWCDDVADPAYNRLVRLPFAARHEVLWRADHIYDLLLVIGHNDAPVKAGAGSAVFIHLARDDYAPTDGCVAFAAADLLEILAGVSTSDHLQVALQAP
jgi:L,D-peptidoglycan transpeptidase YkuD (ErfK/YbiS/YcfS/YnhG family)